MKHQKPQTHGKRQRYLNGIMGAGIILLGTFLIGCQGADSETGASTLGLTSPDTPAAASRPAPPTLGELLTKVELTTEQLQPMESALEKWTAAVQSRRESGQFEGRRGRRGGDRQGLCPDGERGPRPSRGTGRLGDHEPPMLVFLEECAEILNPDQFVAVAEFLVERREAHCETFAGTRPNRPAGFHGRGGPGGQFQGQKSDRMIDELDLTEEQQNALREAREQNRETMQALIQEAGGRGQMDEATRDQIREMREQMKAQMESILTPEQLAQLEELRDERRVGMKEKREANFTQKIERRVEFLSRILDLDETQKQQITEILAQAHEQMQTLHENAREQEMSFADVRAEAEQIKEQTETAIQELLTAEQATMFAALRSLLPQHRGPGRSFRLGR